MLNPTHIYRQERVYPTLNPTHTYRWDIAYPHAKSHLYIWAEKCNSVILYPPILSPSIFNLCGLGQTLVLKMHGTYNAIFICVTTVVSYYGMLDMVQQ